MVARPEQCAEASGPHPQHVGVCTRTGYANGLADGIAAGARLRETVTAIAVDMGSACTMDQWDDLCIRLRAALANP